MNTYDVIVLGLGGMGSSVAYHLARRGKRVLGLERFTPAHDRGSSHGQTRVIRQCYFEHPSYVPLLLRAYDLWRELESEAGDELLLLPGGLMLGAEDSEVVSGSLKSAREYSLPHAMLDRGEIQRRFPAFELPQGTVGLLEPFAGLVRTEGAVLAHLRCAAARGALLQYEEPVQSWTSTSAGVSVTTTRGSYQADHLVITPGPWAPELLRDMHIPVNVERQVLLWFQPKGGIEPFRPERFPIYIWHEAAHRQPYGFPAMDGEQGGVKIAFFRKPETELCTPETIDRRVREDDIETMRASIRRFLPSLDGKFLRGTTCMYTVTPDLNFVIGEHPSHTNVLVACGFSGHGFKFCSVVGDVIADCVIEGRSRLDITLFDPKRFGNGPTMRGGA